MSTGPRDPRVALESLVVQFGAFYVDDRRHRLSLPLLARWLMAEGRPQEALGLLLRYWRTGPDGVADRLLEAALRSQLSGPAGALPALRRAFQLDPTNAAAQAGLVRGLAEAGEAGEAARAARGLLRTARDPAVLVLALDAAEPGWQAFGAADLRGRFIEGWCVWKGAGASRDCTIVADGLSAPFAVGEENHPDWNAVGCRYGRFRIAWPQGAAIVSVQDGPGGRLMRGTPMMNDDALDDGLGSVPDGVEVTVIVPVYADASATRRCFESLAADRASRTRRRVIVVDDASPDPMIRSLLDRLARAGQIVLLRNPQNVGFIRAVNRALKHVRDEDVVLLNADTVVPQGWLDRLREAGRQPGVGTVTPLSNNGEIVSIPNPFRPNPLPGPQRLRDLDAAAQALGAGLVDMPHGVGFCLYVCNAALRAVGGLDERHYERGYLEEVDFCLRIAAAGYRNVCATNLFVAHQGEASFGSSKRELVMANASALVRRWPQVEAETELFVAADPLREVRHALAWAGPPPGPARLVVSPEGPPDRAVLDRLRADRPDCRLVLVTAPGPDPRAWRAALPWFDEAVPLPAELRGLAPADAAARLANLLGVEDVVVLLGKDLAGEVAAAFLGLGLPVDVLPLREGCPAPSVLAGKVRRGLMSTSAAAEALMPLAPSATCLLPAPETPVPDGPAGVGDALGILPVDASAASWAAIRDLARALRKRGSQRQLVVFGGTFRDVGLLRIGNVSVTGPLEDDQDWREAFAVHPCAGFLLPSRQPLYAHQSFDVVRKAGLPFAAYRVGAARDLLSERPDGLALSPAWSAGHLALVLDAFLSSSASAAPARSEAHVA